MSLAPSPKIYLADSHISNAGRGVFAAVAIAKDEEIEICPVIETSLEDHEHLKATKLRDYYFMWSKDEQNKQVAICLDFGSLYNHSYEPNATYRKSVEKQTISFMAIKNIKKDEEITANYNYGNPNDKSKLWLEDVPGIEEDT